MEKKFGELSAEEKQEIGDNAVQATSKSHKVRNENIQRYLSVKFSLMKSAKIQIGTSRFYAGIHEGYITTTIFTSMFLNGLLVLVAPNFRNR